MKKLKLEDYSIIKPYLDMANYEGYNSNFVTMMMWNHEYHIEYEIRDNYLVMLHNYKGNYFWAMPFTTSDNYQKAIDYMIQYSQSHGFEFVIDCAIESFVTQIQKIYQDQFLYQRTPYNDDYIYERQMLESLSGKKMQKRRNHYNAFLKSYPQYVYRDLDLQKDFDTILECLNRWETKKDNLSESMTSEIFGIMYLLSTQHMLDFVVGGIFIDGTMEAFIIASQLHHQTIQIHVEKANKNIRGLYPAILKEMLERHFPDDIYINREEDMGLENLRISKKSLHPCRMIHKYRIEMRHTQVVKASDEDTYQIRQLWQQSFQDEDEETTTFYFDNLYKKENTYVLKQNHQIISVAQIVPMIINKQSQLENCYFILGVCTDKNYQKQGCMKQLLSYIINEYKGHSLYLQAYEPKIYHSFGFYASHYHQKILIDKKTLQYDETLQRCFDYTYLKYAYDEYTSHFDEYRIRDDFYWNNFIKRCQAFHDEIYLFKDKGYFVVHEDEKEIFIYECIYKDENCLKSMLNYFYNKEKDIVIECDMKVNIAGDKENIITMMSNHNDKDVLNKDVFINEIY